MAKRKPRNPSKLLNEYSEKYAAIRSFLKTKYGIETVAKIIGGPSKEERYLFYLAEGEYLPEKLIKDFPESDWTRLKYAKREGKAFGLKGNIDYLHNEVFKLEDISAEAATAPQLEEIEANDDFKASNAYLINLAIILAKYQEQLQFLKSKHEPENREVVKNLIKSHFYTYLREFKIKSFIPRLNEVRFDAAVDSRIIDLYKVYDKEDYSHKYYTKVEPWAIPDYASKNIPSDILELYPELVDFNAELKAQDTMPTTPKSEEMESTPVEGFIDGYDNDFIDHFPETVEAKKVMGTSYMNPSLTTKAFEPEKRVFFLQYTPDKVAFGLPQEQKEAFVRKYNTAQSELGFLRKTYKASRYGNVHVLEKDGQIMTQKGFDAIPEKVTNKAWNLSLEGFRKHLISKSVGIDIVHYTLPPCNYALVTKSYKPRVKYQVVESNWFTHQPYWGKIKPLPLEAENKESEAIEKAWLFLRELAKSYGLEVNEAVEKAIPKQEEMKSKSETAELQEPMLSDTERKIAIVKAVAEKYDLKGRIWDKKGLRYYVDKNNSIKKLYDTKKVGQTTYIDLDTFKVVTYTNSGNQPKSWEVSQSEKVNKAFAPIARLMRIAVNSNADFSPEVATTPKSEEIKITLVAKEPEMKDNKQLLAELQKVMAKYGWHVRLNGEMFEVDNRNGKTVLYAAKKKGGFYVKNSDAYTIASGTNLVNVVEKTATEYLHAKELTEADFSGLFDALQSEYSQTYREIDSAIEEAYVSPEMALPEADEYQVSEEEKADSDLQYLDYSAKSFVVFGDTFPIKDLLTELGGKFNKWLKVKDSEGNMLDADGNITTDKRQAQVFAGYIFKSSDREIVEQALGSLQKGVAKADVRIAKEDNRMPTGQGFTFAQKLALRRDLDEVFNELARGYSLQPTIKIMQDSDGNAVLYFLRITSRNVTSISETVSVYSSTGKSITSMTNNRDTPEKMPDYHVSFNDVRGGDGSYKVKENVYESGLDFTYKVNPEYKKQLVEVNFNPFKFAIPPKYKANHYKVDGKQKLRRDILEREVLLGKVGVRTYRTINSMEDYWETNKNGNFDNPFRLNTLKNAISEMNTYLGLRPGSDYLAIGGSVEYNYVAKRFPTVPVLPKYELEQLVFAHYGIRENAIKDETEPNKYISSAVISSDLALENLNKTLKFLGISVSKGEIAETLKNGDVAYFLEYSGKSSDSNRPLTELERKVISDKLREKGDALDSQIEAKMNPATASQNLTHRRAGIMARMKTDGEVLLDIQSKLYGLADAWLTDSVPSKLKEIRNKSEVELLRYAREWPTVSANASDRWVSESADMIAKLNKLGLFGEADLTEAKAQINQWAYEEDEETQKANQLKAMETNLLGRKIDGFFPTPKGLAERIVRDADIQEGMRVLEPSAGKGDLAEVIMENHPDVDLEVIEIDGTLRKILEAKGFNVVEYDVLDHTGQYDRIVMNPPFEKGLDMEHITYCYENLLRPGGILVSITSESPFFRTGAKYDTFRDFVDEYGYSVKLDEGMFKGKDSFRQTGVSTRYVVLEKPAMSIVKPEPEALPTPNVAVAETMPEEEEVMNDNCFEVDSVYWEKIPNPYMNYKFTYKFYVEHDGGDLLNILDINRTTIGFSKGDIIYSNWVNVYALLEKSQRINPKYSQKNNSFYDLKKVQKRLLDLIESGKLVDFQKPDVNSSALEAFCKKTTPDMAIVEPMPEAPQSEEKKTPEPVKKAKNIILGRDSKIVMPNGEKRKASFAIVELDLAIASHHEETFASSVGYPTDDQGNNINDRNYSSDPNAQANVRAIAQKLEPELIITTSGGISGTPIVTKDAIVVSGNNRTMSLKLAKKQYPSNYQNYVLYLADEIMAYGFKSMKLNAFTDKWEVEAKSGEKQSFESPILVRIDHDFPAYNTAELSKYNRSEMKSERPVDRAIRLSQTLRTQFRCHDNIGRTIGEFETLSEFYNSRKAEKDVLSYLKSCNVIVENEQAQFYDSVEGFNENGKNLLESVLSAVILEKDGILASDFTGVKRFRQIIVSSLSVLVKHQTLGVNFTKEINDAVVLEKRINSSGQSFTDFTRQFDLFDAKPSRNTLIMNRLLAKGRNTFKGAIHKYNEAYVLNQTPSLLGDNKTPEEIFNFYIVSQIDEDDLNAIDLLSNFGGAKDAKIEAEAAKQAEENERERLRLKAKKEIELAKALGLSFEASPKPEPKAKMTSKVELLEQQIEDAKNKMLVLSGERDPLTHSMSEEYYKVLRSLQEMREELNNELEKLRLARIGSAKKDISLEEEKAIEAKKAIEEKRAIKEANVTSLTYERAKRRLDKQVDGWLTGKKKQ